MLDQTLKYQTTILKQEITQILHSSNIHKVPELKKVLVTSIMPLAMLKKSILSHLCGTQLALKKKGFIVQTKKSNSILKYSKGIPIGTTITLNKKRSSLFLLFLIDNLIPKLDWINILELKNGEQCFNFNLSSTEIIKELVLLNTFFTSNLRLDICLLCYQKKQKGKILWRFLKIPIK